MAEGQTNESNADPVNDVTGQQIARRYAQGFLSACGAGADAAVADLDSVDQEVFEKHPRMFETLCSSFLEHEQRVEMIDRVFGSRVDVNVVRLLKVLSSHGRMELARSVAKQARELHNESQNRVDVLVRLAAPADDAQLSEISQAVGAKLGVEPVVKVEIDPNLIGGLEIRVGDTVFDGSLRTAFKIAHKSIVEQTVQAIETQPERFTAAV